MRAFAGTFWAGPREAPEIGTATQPIRRLLPRNAWFISPTRIIHVRARHSESAGFFSIPVVVPVVRQGFGRPHTDAWESSSIRYVVEACHAFFPPKAAAALYALGSRATPDRVWPYLLVAERSFHWFARFVCSTAWFVSPDPLPISGVRLRFFLSLPPMPLNFVPREKFLPCNTSRMDSTPLLISASPLHPQRPAPRR